MNYQSAQRARRQQRNRRKGLIGLALLMVIIGVGFFWTHSDNQAQIVQSQPPKKAKPGATYKNFDSSYIGFSYKSTYQAHALAAQDEDLERYQLRANTLYDKQLAVFVSPLKDGRLDNNGSYLMRKSNSSLYSESEVQADGGAVSLWTKADNKEITIFIPRGNRVAVLSFTTTSAEDDLEPEASAVLASFRWKNLNQ